MSSISGQIASVFTKLETAAEVYSAPKLTASAALLTWFLENVYRLERIEAQDAVCDQPDDKGVDAIVVNDEAQEIVVFQSKRREKPTSTVGDSALKEFVGTLAQFETASGVAKLEAETKSMDLARILSTEKVAQKIDDGYLVRPIFVTNVPIDRNGQTYLEKIRPASNHLPIDPWDNNRLRPVVDQLDREWAVDERFDIRVARDKILINTADGNISQIFGVVRATELVNLPGIADFRIFAQNVRLGLGNTRVNKDIVQTIKDPIEHKDFLSFHNGLTVVARDLTYSRGRIKMNHYSVCNGCQSLLQFYRNQDDLTGDLEVLVRFVRVGNDRSLSELIAYRTNNQNPITLRDLSSNDSAQIQLKSSFDSSYGFACEYDIRRGAPTSTATLQNEHAGQMVLSLYVGRPWDAHQKYRIFSEFKNEIFGFGMTASRIRFAQLLYELVLSKSVRLKDVRIRNYGLTQFILLYLLGEMLREESEGHALLSDPEPYLERSDGANKAKQAQIMEVIGELADEMVDSVDFYVEDRQTSGEFDYKSLFKSRDGIAPIHREVLSDRRKAKRKKDPTFLILP